MLIAGKRIDYKVLSRYKAPVKGACFFVGSSMLAQLYSVKQ